MTIGGILGMTIQGQIGGGIAIIQLGTIQLVKDIQADVSSSLASNWVVLQLPTITFISLPI